MKEVSKSVRRSTSGERARARVIAFSSFVVVLMLALAVTFTAITLAGPRGEEDEPPVGGKILMTQPVNGEFSIAKGFSGTMLQYNATMRRWEAHRCVTVTAPLGTAVVATYDGTVTVSSDAMFGTVVTITHRDGVQTIFQGLNQNVSVSSGQRVTQGQPIGTIGSTMLYERLNPASMRIVVMQNGARVNPAEFIDFGDK
jgi:murein DD-endopeptidase MepM/ murein hydrolase activator NlpD